MKRTSMVSNKEDIVVLNAECPGCVSHQLLAGKAPCGKNWTQVACPYWPRFGRVTASDFGEKLKSQVHARKGKPHASGLFTSDADASVMQLLKDSGWSPSAHGTSETIDFAVGAAR